MNAEDHPAALKALNKRTSGVGLAPSSSPLDEGKEGLYRDEFDNGWDGR
jgi:hypothetical protein